MPGCWYGFEIEIKKTDTEPWVLNKCGYYTAVSCIERLAVFPSSPGVPALGRFALNTSVTHLVTSMPFLFPPAPNNTWIIQRLRLSLNKLTQELISWHTFTAQRGLRVLLTSMSFVRVSCFCLAKSGTNPKPADGLEVSIGMFFSVCCRGCSRIQDWLVIKFSLIFGLF